MRNVDQPVGVVSGVNYLNVCAHCNDCLNQFVWEPNKLNVVIFYRNEKGDIVEWKPADWKSKVEGLRKKPSRSKDKHETKLI